MSFPAIRLSAKAGLDCYLTSVPAWRLFAFLNHDPRSKTWKTALSPWLREIYESKQRSTTNERIVALQRYVTDRLMDEHTVGALPPISVVQFEPLAKDQIHNLDGSGDVVVLDEGKAEVNRVLIDGLARVSAVAAVREEMQEQNPDAYEKMRAFEFAVALYVPSEIKVGPEVAGQLFTDFNSYAWPVPAAKTLVNDQYNLYKNAAELVRKSPVIIEYGGLKDGSSNLGRKDTNFTTLLVMAQFCKVAVEGKRAIGNLNKPLSNPNIAKVGMEEVAARVVSFFSELATEMGPDTFSDRSQLFRSAHGLYALAIIVGDIAEGKTTLRNAARGLARIDWTWDNEDFQQHIGRKKHAEDGTYGWKMNTGAATIDWLITYCRQACKVPVPRAA